jgi:ATP-dependent helicase/DNAse subunit B
MPPEQPRELVVGGLRLRARIDRIDRLDDGSLVVIDYKSTAPSLAAWEGSRPDEPQLPLYATSLPEAVSAVAFAQVRTGDSHFRGYGAEPLALPGIKAAEMEDLLDAWRGVLALLAGAFRSGHAAVDPKQRATCDYCHLHPLCRICESR